MEIVKNIRENEALRRSFNALAEKTFGLNFEGWLQNGYWTDNYIPYAMVEDGRVIANVSANRTDMLVSGKRWKLVQLGTVMTEESHRNRGLIRALMAEIDKDFADADGMYLFGGDNVVHFYPKFGFETGKEYICSKSVIQSGENTLEMVPMDTPENRMRLEKAMEESRFVSGCEMLGNPQLIFFYVFQFMQEAVFHSAALDAWIIAEQEGDDLFIHTVFGPQTLQIEDVIATFGGTVRKVTLGFSPADVTGWKQADWHEEDCTFFVKGGAVELFRENQIRIPTLSHA